jgi:hypothetical protein
MIDEALRPVVQSKTELAAYNSGGFHPAPQRNGHSCNSWLQPAGTGRPDGSVGSAILEASGETPEQMRHRHEAADPGRTNVARRIQHFGNQAQMMQPRV